MYFFKRLFLLLSLCLLLSCDNTSTIQPLPTDATILAFGDSLTYGTGASRDKAYPAVLEQLINRKVINAGIPGETSGKGLRRLRQLLLKHQPDLIIICHGANDILRKFDLSQTSNNLQQMIYLANQHNSQVVLIAVPEFSLFLSPSPMYEILASKNNIPLEEDILGDLLSNNALKADHVHPNAEGYQKLAEKIASLLKDSGAIP